MKNLIFLSLIALMFTASCLNTGKISRQNISFIYDDTYQSSPEFYVFHDNDSTSCVFINYRFHSPGLLDNSDSAAYLLKYKLFSSFNSKTILDSATISFPYYKIKDIGIGINLEFNINTTFINKYLLELIFADTLNNKVFREFINVNKKNKYNRQNFIFKNKAGESIYKNYLDFDDEFRLKYRERISGKLFVNYYKRDFPIAQPPFVLNEKLNFDHKPDSVFNVKLHKGETDLLKLVKPGFYHFFIKHSDKEGFSVFRFYNGFPFIKNAFQMIEPLRYITTEDEYNELTQIKDRKKAIEKFWINIAGSEERASILIRNYYQKVQEANRLFTSYHEGWKTDRGMIHIIFDSPDIVFKEENIETWIYGEANKASSLVFDFIKVDNTFTDNDFRLIKSPNFKTRWYFAVEAWRR